VTEFVASTEIDFESTSLNIVATKKTSVRRKCIASQRRLMSLTRHRCAVRETQKYEPPDMRSQATVCDRTHNPKSVTRTLFCSRLILLLKFVLASVPSVVRLYIIPLVIVYRVFCHFKIVTLGAIARQLEV
jgi:hypothetical protein